MQALIARSSAAFPHSNSSLRMYVTLELYFVVAAYMDATFCDQETPRLFFLTFALFFPNWGSIFKANHFMPLMYHIHVLVLATN